MGVRKLFELSGRTALVTGGSRGLGLQIAEALVEMGAKVAITARKKDELDAAKKALGSSSFTFVCDIGKREGAKPGDLFIVFRDNPVVKNARTAVAEVVLLKVEDRASTALVTYSDDAISLGDVVERR
jgi:NAD(P)-dependent dehydrogenase (short-subunit alcohol dehydrogenase family)